MGIMQAIHNYLSRYWTVTVNDITNPNYDISVVYPSGDISGTESQIAAGVWSGSLPWTKFNAANTGSNTITATGLTGTGIDFTGITLAPPTVTINGGNASETICDGSSVALTANATGDPTITYSWSSSPVTTISPNNTSSINVSPPASPATSITNYTYTVLVTDGNGFTASDNIGVTVNPTPTATAPSNQTYCNGETTSSITLSGTPSGVVFDISGGTSIGLANQTGVTAIPAFTAMTGSATISITPRANGCTGSSVTYDITVNPTPTATAPSNQTYCNGETTSSISLTGTPSGVVFDISGGTSIGLANQTGVTAVPAFTATTGTATISIIPRANGCAGSAVTYSITVNPTPTATAPSNQTYCNGETTSSITLSGTPSGVVFDISGGTSIGLANQTNVSAIPPFTATTGNATISIIPKANGCNGTAVTYGISVLPTPDATISGTTQVCQNDSPLPVVTITNPMALPVTVTYNINGSGTTVNIAANSNVTVAQPTTTAGTYNYNLVSVAYQSGTACSNTLSGTATITVNPTPTVNAISNQVLCNNITTPGITLSGPVAGTTFTWTNSNPAIGLAASGSGNIPAFSTTNGTNGPITGTITVTPTANGCPGTPLTFTITINPTPTASISGSTSVCQNDASPDITFTNPLSLPVTVTYRKNSIAQTINVAANGTANVGVPTTTAGTYTYKLTSVAFQSNPTCSNVVSDSVTVIVYPRANAVPTPASQAICSTEEIDTIVLTSSTPGVTFNWTTKQYSFSNWNRSFRFRRYFRNINQYNRQSGNCYIYDYSKCRWLCRHSCNCYRNG